MEMGSSSFSASAGGASGSTDSSLNGLKFGKKIYFEDVVMGVSAKSDGGSSSVSEVGSTSASATERKGRGVVQGGQPPRCQVEGCKVDLSGSKGYYSRHKVCGMHSKSPKVVVAGLEQRFCQQCSRFHQLAEFDQGKRSCRRRLAGHNERRRKPQPGPVFSACYGRLSSSLQENSSRVGAFLMDFTTYPKLPGRDIWPTVRAGNWAPGNQPTSTAKFLPHQWQGSSENPASNYFSNSSHSYLQDSSGGTIFSSSRIPSGECFAGVSDSGCALSLLSTQPWGLRNQASGLSMNNLINDEGSSMAQSTAPHGAAMTNFTSNLWSFKGDELISGSSHQMQPINSNFSSELELAQQGDRQYMELGQGRAYGSSTQQLHWSL